MMKEGLLFCLIILIILLSLTTVAFLTRSNILFSSIRPFPNPIIRDLAISSSLLPSLPPLKSKGILNSLDNFIKLSKAIETAERKLQGKAFIAFLREAESGQNPIYHIELITDLEAKKFTILGVDIDACSGEIIETKTQAPSLSPRSSSLPAFK